MVTNAEVKLNFVEDLVLVRGYGVIFEWGSTAREVRVPRRARVKCIPLDYIS